MTKISLKELQKSISPDYFLDWDGQDLRTEKTNKDYENYKLEIRRENLTPEKIIERDILKGKDFVLTESAFPYDNVDCSHHFILWIKDKDKENQRRLEIINKIPLTNYFIFFKNRPKYQSVQGILHYHFLFKDKLF